MYMHLYMNNPTAGGTDGTQITEGTGLTPLTIGPLRAATNEESAAVKLAIRCDTGYQTADTTTITPAGTTANKWALAPDNAGTPGAFGAYGAPLTLASGIGTTNKLFWAKAKAASSESPTNDTSVSLYVTCSAITAA